MSTNDVPGANPRNNDELAMGCWAEHADGSLIVVESTEDDRVVYSVFDVAQSPTVEYRDTMAVGAFKKTFSWKPSDPKSEKWTWHDKTPFPWDRVIVKGARDGARLTHADHIETAAERVRQSRNMRSRQVDEHEVSSRIERLSEKAKRVVRKLQRAIEELDT